jgi:anti-anti-sigma factor
MTVATLGEHLVKITLVGRLDSQGVDSIETRFTAHLVPAANNAIVDLSGVDFVASLGLRLFVSTARNLSARHAKLALFGAQGPVLQIFEAVAMSKIIPICATEADALKAVAPAAQ